MFAFVWLPRDELTTRRRIAIGEMIERGGKGRITNWSVDLGDGDLALVRYTLNVDAKTPTPDAAALDRRLDAMVRGWEPAVEEALGELVGAARATRLPMTYAAAFPPPYRARTAPPTPPRTSSASRARRRPAALGAALPAARSIPRTISGSKSTARAAWCRSPTRCRCSRISASACSRRRRPGSTAAEGHIHEFLVVTADGRPAGR